MLDDVGSDSSITLDHSMLVSLVIKNDIIEYSTLKIKHKEYMEYPESA